MQICISGKFEPSNLCLYNSKEIDKVSWIGNGFVFVQYLSEDIFWGNVFMLEDGTEIILREIKLQFDTTESLTEISRGWKCLCRFDNLDLGKVPTAKDWFSGESLIIARRKES